MLGPVGTKLLPPRSRDDVIRRQRLTDALSRSLFEHRLTLVSAPAGYGKTTLLSSLLQVRPELNLAWLTVGPEDDDPYAFLAGVVGALRRVLPGCCTEASSLLSGAAGWSPEPRQILSSLINEILDVVSDDLVIAIDDLHAVTAPGVYELLDFLLDRIPPFLHLVIASRHDPPLALARLRARRQLQEVRLEALRFTLPEAQLLSEGLGLQLAPEIVRLIWDRTGGWVTGLCLWASSQASDGCRDAAESLAADWGASNRHVFEFLADEVLDRQSPRDRDFLLRTSVLFQLTPPSCAVVTGFDDAGEILERVYRRNLFLTAVEGEEAVFRYHDLFREFALEQLRREEPGLLAELHRRAATVETEPERAIHHHLVAGAWVEAARVIDDVGGALIRQGSVETMRRWIGSLPEEITAARPRTEFLLGECAWLTWDLQGARALFQRARAGFEAEGDGPGETEASVHLATCLRTMADMAGVAALTERLLGTPLAPRDRIQVLIEDAWVALHAGRWEDANRNLDVALQLSAAGEDPQCLRTLALGFGSAFSVLPGGTDRSERIWALLATHGDGAASPAQLALHANACLSRLWRGHWDDAIHQGNQALQIAEELGGRFIPGFEVAVVLPICHTLRGDDETADAVLASSLGALAGTGTEALVMPWISGFFYLWGRVRWLQGRLDAAREFHARLLASASPAEFPMAPVLRTMMAGLLEISDGCYDDAEKCFRDAAERQHRLRFSALFGNADLLLAHALYRQGRHRDSLEVLAPVLAGYERDATPGFLLWEGSVVEPLLRLAVEHGVHALFAARVLDSLPAGPSASTSVTAPLDGASGTLTRRQVDVLRLVADGCTDRQVAARLFISPRTVGRHLSVIYRTLGVSSRAAAVRIAIEQDLFRTGGG